MPELPEVTTMVNGLRSKVLKRTFVDVWTDAEKLVKKPKDFNRFKKGIAREKIIDIKRRGKVVLFCLNSKKTLFVHPKMTGHFLVGKWKRTKGEWKPIDKGPMQDPMNRFIHIMFWLDNGQMLAFSDMRKFGRIELWDNKSLGEARIISELGVDALELGLEQFREIIKKAGNRKIKQVLMNQNLIAGIGNIYADEILFLAGILPFRTAKSLKAQELEKIHKAISKILLQAIKLAGSSIPDFRQPSGERGRFQDVIKVYGRTGGECPECGTIIQRKIIGSRSAHFCPKCQK
ncbi:MAG: DNA-formamidopyrimidine glycosylase [Parcubacteria group bacterium CG08_land_8_20_14_0_20_43_9]|nr:MAG: DNA-formamidopyrimidine glycosylase [Parcubacteria group bacterium CG08_land_8_20_14_0_20_43_9]